MIRFPQTQIVQDYPERCEYRVVLAGHVLNVNRQTKRSHAKITVEVSDDLAQKLIADITSQFPSPIIRALEIQWFEIKPKE